MKKAANCMLLAAFVLTNGRCERIRTFDPLHPMLYFVHPRKSITFLMFEKYRYKSMFL